MTDLFFEDRFGARPREAQVPIVFTVGAITITMPALMTPVSTRPTGTVPIPPIL